MRTLKTSLLLSASLAATAAHGGDLNPTQGPGSYQTYTLEDVYQRLDTGAAGSQSGYTGPAAGPTTGTMHTVNDIMGKAPVVDDASGAMATEVLQGRTFWGLRSDGTWGPTTGSLATQSIDNSQTDQAAGNYSAFDLASEDTDLIPGHIAEGQSIFGVTGTAKVATGDAGAGQVLTGYTFSNTMVVGEPGAMPDRSGMHVEPPAFPHPIPAGYYDGATNVTAQAELVAANIACGVTLFGVTGTHGPSGQQCVAKTGQTTIYDDGDDGEYQKGCEPTVTPPVLWADFGGYDRTTLLFGCPDPGFTINGDGTVTDELTSLVWLQNANCFGFANWGNALDYANTLASGACGLSDGSIGGSWRVPNINELRSLLDRNRPTISFLPAGHPFTGAAPTYYWSSTTYVSQNNIAWNVFLAGGTAEPRGKNTDSSLVWPVRSGQ